MRLLIDAQCIQSTSSLRGIGRYALSLTRALVEEAGAHRVEVLLNAGDDPVRLLRARSALETFLPARSVHVFDAAWAWTPPYDPRRRLAAEGAYRAAVQSIDPDVLLVGSVFEGDAENVMSVGATADDPPAAAILYDLIPAIDPGTYLLGPGASIYWRRFESLRHCRALLGISRYSGDQASALLGDTCPHVTPVWGGPYPSGDFPAFEATEDDGSVSIPSRFVLSVGGAHPRKNLDRLVQAWARVPSSQRLGTPLVIACRLNAGTVRRLRRLARRHGLAIEDLVLTGGVSETTLEALYEGALAFVFPSTEEGLGMPPLEAMATGCPTLLARGSSLSELSDDPDCFFDGCDVDDMSRALGRLLTDEDFLGRLRASADITAQRFTWRRTARLAWAALESISAGPRPPTAMAVSRPVLLSDAAAVTGLDEAPGPVLLDIPLETGRTSRLELPSSVRASLAPATVLVAPDTDSATAAVRAGLFDIPIVVGEQPLPAVARHDFHRAYAKELHDLKPLSEDIVHAVVEAASRPPRWTLERPRPVWLLLHPTGVDGDVVDACRGAGVDLISSGLDGAALAAAADVVLVVSSDLLLLQDAMSEARRRGAVIAVLTGVEAASDPPDWCTAVPLDGEISDAAAWQAGPLTFAADWGRTTGWPWRGRS